MYIDQPILSFFVDHRVAWLSFLMLAITYSGSFIVVGAITFLSSISLYIHKHAVFIFPLLVSVCGCTITVFTFKNIFYRARPLAEALYLETSMSFPSGHSAIAAALYGFIIYIIYKSDKHKLKTLFIAGLSLLIFFIGFSRLYLGVHYFSDVLAGYAIGFIWLWIGMKISKKIERVLNWSPKIRN